MDLKSPFERAEKKHKIVNYILYCSIIFTILLAAKFELHEVISIVPNNQENHSIDSIATSNVLTDRVISHEDTQRIVSSVKAMGEFKIILASVLVVLLLTMFSIGLKADKLIAKMDDAQKQFEDSCFIEDFAHIFSSINEYIQTRNKTKESKLDIIAYTLQHLSSKLEHWAEQNKLKNITINLYHLDADFIIKSPNINSDWANLIAGNLKTIHEYKEANKSDFIRDNVNINLIPYKHIPAISGVRIDDRLFVSIAQWSRTKFVKESDQATYMQFLPDNQTRAAQYFRMIFDNWILKSTDFKYEVSDDTPFN